MAIPQLTVTALKSIIGSLGYKDIKNLSTTSFAVLSNTRDADKVIPKIQNALKPFKPKVRDKRTLEVNNLMVAVKLRKNQRQSTHLSFGRENEMNFKTAIHEYLRDNDGPLTIHFTQNGRTKFTVKDVVKIIKTGDKNIFTRLKGDVTLATESGKKVPVSLKKLDAGYWESADSYWGVRAKAFLEWALANKATELVPVDNIYKLNPPIATKATPREVLDVCFGRDIHGTGAILVQTWKTPHFQYDEESEALFVECDNVILRPSDIADDHEVYFEIRNDRTRNSKNLYPGLRAMAAMKSNLRGDKILSFSRANESPQVS